MNGESSAQLYLEDFEPGQVYAGQTRTMGEEAFALFARMTGDAHPIHYDQAYARTTQFGERVCHGLLLMAITALGATPLSARLEKSMVAFIEQDGRFEKAVLLGETVTTEFEVEEVRMTSSGDRGIVRFVVRVSNGNGEQVLLAHHAYLIRARPV